MPQQPVTQAERNVAASAMAKVTTVNTLDVMPEQEHAETLYEELLDCLPVLAVRTAAEGKPWFDTTAPSALDRVILRRWVEHLPMPEVQDRLNFCFGQTHMHWHPLITPFREALRTYYTAK